MKLFKLLILFLIPLLYSCNNNNNSIQQKVKFVKTKRVFPFSEAEYIEIFSYKTNFETSNPFSNLLNDNVNFPNKLKEILESNKLNVKERIKLNPEQQDELFEILYNEECGDEILGNCFTPRHAIIFFDKNNTPIAFSELSLECITANFSKGFNKYKLCESKINKLKTFFEQIGIAYFEEPMI
jgi:hypothetical protein